MGEKIIFDNLLDEKSLNLKRKIGKKNSVKWEIRYLD